jgi:hypothetical protein
MAPLRKKGMASASATTAFSPTHLLFLILFLVIGGLVYLLSFSRHPMFVSAVSSMYPNTTTIMANGGSGFTSTPLAAPLFPISSRTADVLSDPYAPPLKNDIFMSSQMPSLLDIRGPPAIMASVPVVPVNIPSRGYDSPYTQIGILNRADGTGDLILPLMGKQASTARDRYNYYTISNTGSVNTKLPVKVNGKSGVSEYGCDEIMSGDTVYVDGYNAPFRTTVYENNTFRYLPVL